MERALQNPLKRERPWKKRIAQILHNIYYGYGKEGALNNNVETLLRLVRATPGGTKCTRKLVIDFLTKQPSYTVHRRVARRQFPRRIIRVPTRGVRVDADLIELGDLSPWNAGHRYILVLIDAFSRYVWAKPMKNKQSDTAANALKHIIARGQETNRFHTLVLYSDGGREFIGAPFQSVLKREKIKHRICTSNDYHCPFVERVIRTIKEKLFQAMTSSLTRTWLDLLPKVVSTYNQTIHSSTNQRPIDANKEEYQLRVLSTLNRKQRLQYSQHKSVRYTFRVGDLVRILRGDDGALGRKGYLPRFTWEIFRVRKLATDRALDLGGPPAYILEDLNGELIEHAIFYESELSLVHPDQLLRESPIREILAEKGGKVKVWFLGFPKADAQWIDRRKLVYKTAPR